MATDLGLLGFDDPKTLGLLSLGLRLMSTPGKFGAALGQSGLGALGDMQAQRQMLQQQKRQQMMDSITLQQAQQQKAEFDRQQQERAAVEAAAKGALVPGKLPSYMDARDIGLPGELQAIPAQQFDSNKFVQNLLPVMPLKAMEYQAALKRAAPTLTKLGKGESAGFMDPETGVWKTIAQGNPEQEKPDELDVTLRKAGIMPGTPQYAQAYADRAKKLTTHQPAASVSVNTGQKGYENESKLRNDFKSEPIYKEYQDTATAYKQIKAALSQANPIGDTAAATKIMKILDPGSVVRESELAMAMAATGKIDRLKNFVNMWATGEKLTPTQRVEFSRLADEFYAVAAKAYNNKRGEYAVFGKEYGLKDSVLGPQADVGQKRKPVYNPATQRLE